MHTITLFVPGLFGPESALTQKTVPAASQLHRVLARAVYIPHPYPGFSAQVFRLFGIQENPEADYPAAAASYLGDTNRRPEGYWMCADPVHLSPGYHGLVLDHHTLSINQDEALALTSELEDIFKHWQMHLEAPIPGRWYIKLKRPAAIRTHEIHAVIGRHIRPLLPEGPAQISWLQLCNEIQMQLHAAAVNKKRQACGQIPVNSIWFWGGGQLPAPGEKKWSVIYTDDAIAKGLAILSGIPVFTLPMTAITPDMRSKKTHTLIIIKDGLRHLHEHDCAAWIDFLAQLEKNWISKLVALFNQHTSVRIELVTELGSFILNRYAMLKFWRNHYVKHSRH